MFTQNNRQIQITTPLGKDVLLLQGFTGQEGISRLFHFDLLMHSINPSIKFEDIVGKPATIKLYIPNQKPRCIHGLISSFVQGGASKELAHYHATLVPWLWMLTRTSDCRIFQNLSVPEILKKIFEEYKFPDYNFRIQESQYKKREYCVQYRETDFNFVSRLLEEEGIFYFFEHEESKHTLILADQATELNPCPHFAKVDYETQVGVNSEEGIVAKWSIGQEVRPGKYQVTDYNFEQPSMDLATSAAGQDERLYEIYDYPGEYQNLDHGESLVNIRMQEEELARTVVTGEGTCRGFLTGHRFELKRHYRREANKPYVLTTVFHSADQGTNYRSSDGDSAKEFHYTNQFQCVPHGTPYRPPRITPVPVIHGTQTAAVVGPPGEEIYTDKYGRVKVQFHWDREGKRDENSSCWIRVSHPWAGKGWGGVSIPRIGQEVVVSFLEGDPDRPLIVGRVYNAEQMPPFELPGGMVVSGIKSNTHKGKGYNEFSLDDTAGKEKITIHGQYDMNTTVEHDQTSTVHNCRTDQIDVDDTETVGSNQTLTVGGNRTRTVVQNEVVTVALTRTHTVGINEAITVGAAQEVTVGAMQMVTVGASQQVSVGINRSTDVGKDDSLSAGKNISISAGKNISIDAGDQILIKTGNASILMKKDGTIVIEGKDITIKGSGKMNIKASKTITMKGEKILQN